MDFIATAAFGVEGLVKKELQHLGMDAACEIGGVRFAAAPAQAFSANLWLRTADRVLLIVGEGKTLSFEDLIKHSARLLTEDGQLALILPAEAENEIRQLAGAEGFFLTRVTRVYSKESKPARRVLMNFEITKSRDHVITLIEDTLVLEDEKGGRSLPYQTLCRDFYL